VESVLAEATTHHELTQNRSSSTPSESNLPIPNGLNFILVAGVFGVAVTLLLLGARAETWYVVTALGVVYSYVLLTNYALLHEATHNNLHSSKRLNYWLGVATGLLFPVPFTMIHTTHQGHHLRNRTDHEMFDLYYPTDNRLIKFAQWYSILVGLFWPIIPLGGLVAALWPGFLRLRPFQHARSSSYVLGDIHGAGLWAIRGEMLLILAFYAAVVFFLQVPWQTLLIFYAFFAVNWSTRQYVGHAFSRRDVIEGAWNLRHNRLMTWVLLHGEWDLNHHRRPDLSWYYLPGESSPNEQRPSYVRQYWRLWLGPRRNTEPAPEAVQQLPLSVHP
jgi:fatty acid desaturase